MKKTKQHITFEGTKVFINDGYSKIDATMAFKVGIAIGNKDFKEVELIKVKS